MGTSSRAEKVTTRRSRPRLHDDRCTSYGFKSQNQQADCKKSIQPEFDVNALINVTVQARKRLTGVFNSAESLNWLGFIPIKLGNVYRSQITLRHTPHRKPKAKSLAAKVEPDIHMPSTPQPGNSISFPLPTPNPAQNPPPHPKQNFKPPNYQNAQNTS
ncbi:hypothetical protein FA15DRAFT_742997 [Coprinopsis marcescibilis]|uniref:Uncharacterized protein n=1 Tax=Coprinopsis marcescibilis TaxID=230819 RepID=A0A5C3KU40_COPMA|nr:hypothetical protein FA15DRAFT_742997 [Coprinopsis marcescibilis]